MAAAAKTSIVPTWVSVIGTLLLLLGLFFSTKTLVNMFMFPSYPTVPSTSLGGFLGLGANLTEESCYYSSLGQAAGEPDANCIKAVTNSRDAARVTDVTNSAFFVLAGIAMLNFSKRFFR